MLQITTDFQPKLGIFQSAVIPKGSLIQIGLIGPQKGMGLGIPWFQIYAPNRVKF